ASAATPRARCPRGGGASAATPRAPCPRATDQREGIDVKAKMGRARRGKVLASLTAAERRTLLSMASVVAGLHAAGFFILIALVAPHHYRLGTSGAFTIGLGLTAYTLGLRHAFVADHIAAIDRTTRKLMAERERPLSVGFFFSLGHSSVVFLLSFAFAVGIRALGGQVRNGGSVLHQISGW